MALVTYLGESYECSVALKGDDYIRLLDASGAMIVSFEGVSDFAGFSISDGDWTIPAKDHDCHVAVIREDGSIGKGGHRCCTLAGFFRGESVTLPASGWQESTIAAAEQTIQVDGMTAEFRPLVELDMSGATADNGEALQVAWGAIGRVVSGDGTLTFYAYGSAPDIDLPVFI